MRAFTLAFLTVLPATTLAAISQNARCGGTTTCLGSKWGNCCSQFGWCGSTNAYCSTGCQTQFGICSTVSGASVTTISSGFRTSVSTRTTSSAPSSTQLISTNARCGPKYNGRTCLASKWGNCCSQYSYCGSTDAYCAADTCQKGYGLCNDRPSLSSSLLSFGSQSSSILGLALSSTATSMPQGSVSSSSSVPISSTGSSYLTIVTSSTSSTIASLGPSSSTAPPACATTVAACERAPISFQDNCDRTSNGNCRNGYIQACHQAPKSGVSTQLEVSSVEECATKCNAAANCVAFLVPTGAGVKPCILYSSVQTETTSTDADTYFKVCVDASVASSSTASLPSLSTLAAIAPSSSSTAATLSAPPSSVPSISSSTAISSIPSPTMSSSSLTPSSSNTPGACATTVASCTDSNPFANACDTALDSRCNNGYVQTCFIQASYTASREIGATTNSIGACLAACNADSTCVGLRWNLAPIPGLTVNYCELYTRLERDTSKGTITNVYWKACVDSSLATSSSTPSPVVPSGTATPTPTAQLHCNVAGLAVRTGINTFPMPNYTLGGCKAACQDYTSSNYECKFFAYDASQSKCIVTMHSFGLTWNQVVESSATSSSIWFEVGCDVSSIVIATPSRASSASSASSTTPTPSSTPSTESEILLPA